MGAAFANILRGNVLEFVAWALFTKQVAELDDADRSEAFNFVTELEQRFGWEFAEGFNTAVKPIRINFDKLRVWCHPLLYYVSMCMLRVATRQTLRLLGFTYYGGPAGSLSFFHYAPPRPGPGVLLIHGECTQETRRPPIVFIHGLGVGLAPYLRFIRRLAGGSRECFVIELLEVSQSGTRVVLSPDAMADAVDAMLRAHGHDKACFVAHSYGTFLLSWMLRARSGMVAKMVLLDPVCFLLAQPDVASNFLYREPSNLFSYVVANMVRWELFSANVLMRHFYWYHNVMWLEDLPEETIVALSGKDDITNARAVREYLSRCPRRKGGVHLKLLWFENFFHGEILLSKYAQVQLMEMMCE